MGTVGKLFILLFLIVGQFAMAQSFTFTPQAAQGGGAILAKGEFLNPSFPPPAPILPDSGQGTRLMWIPSLSAFRAGTSSGCCDWNRSNIGAYSFAGGLNTHASGYGSTAMGEATQATHYYTTAFGYYTVANNFYATAAGINTKASGKASTALGEGTIAKAYGSTAIGAYNNDFLYFPDANFHAAGNRIFEIGNGYNGKPSNALTVYRTARTVINDITVTDAMFRIKHNSNADDSHIVLYENENDYARINFKNNGTSSFWMLGGSPQATASGSSFIIRYSGSFMDVMSLNGEGNVTFAGCVTASNLTCPSDIRYKKNIQPLSNSLQNIQKMQGVRYDWKRDEFPEKNFSQQSQIGFIAQEIETVFPEMVLTDEKGYKSVDYARLTPVLVEAIKELSVKNGELEIKNQNLEARLTRIEALVLPDSKKGSVGK